MLAAQLGYCVMGPGELCAVLAGDQRPATVLVSEYDPDADTRADELLRGLAALPRVRLVLACGGSVPDLGDVPGTVLELEGPPRAGRALAPEQSDALDPADEGSVIRGILVAPHRVSAAVERAWPGLGDLRRAQWDGFGQALTTAEPDPETVLPLIATAAMATGDAAMLEAARRAADGTTVFEFWPAWTVGPGVAGGPDTGDGARIGPVGALAGSTRADGTPLMLAADALGRVHAFEPGTGAVLGRPAALDEQATGLAWLTSGRLLAVNSSRRVVLAGAAAAEAEHAHSITDILDPDHSPEAHDRAVLDAVTDMAGGMDVTALDGLAGRWIGIGRGEGSLAVYDTADRRLSAAPAQVHFGAVTGLAVVGGDTVVSGGQDGAVHESSAVGGALGRVREIGRRATGVAALAAVFLPDGRGIAAVGWLDGVVTVYERGLDAQWTQRGVVPLGWTPRDLWLAPDGALIAAGRPGLVALNLAYRWATR